jgi:predicted Rossmann-fold nucleotide-binding protein
MAQEVKWPIKNLCLFCGSSMPKDQSFADAAEALTKEMLSRGIGLVYGGGTRGMMGILGKAIHEGMFESGGPHRGPNGTHFDVFIPMPCIFGLRLSSDSGSIH